MNSKELGTVSTALALLNSMVLCGESHSATSEQAVSDALDIINRHMELQAETGARYYVHDVTRGYVGNSMVWWRKGNAGYSCNLDEAKRFEYSQLKRVLEAEDLVAFPCEYIDAIARPHVDMQHFDMKGIAGSEIDG